MAITLYHHPYSRAANVVWMLEELKVSYDLRFVDFANEEQKSDAIRALNPMGKLPIVVDGDVVMTEVAAIGLYLADRYALGSLAPALDDPGRATYLRWALYAPSVIEPGCAAQAAGHQYRAGAVGWGTYAEMLDTVERAIGEGPWLLGDRFTMADVIFGGTVRYMLRFKMIEARPSFAAYAERLNARPASQLAQDINGRIIRERGL